MASSSATTAPGHQHPPSPPEPTGRIPVIDLSRLHQKRCEATRSLVIEDIGRACRIFGCFQVVNHGISKSVMKGALEVASDFFKLPAEEKKEFESDDIKKPVRFTTTSKDGMEGARLMLKHYAHPLDQWLQWWPLNPPAYREKMGRYTVEVRRVGVQVMQAILESLGLGQAYMADELNRGMQVMAVNWYPRSPLRPPPPATATATATASSAVFGLAPHTDFGYITILLQSCYGFQVLMDDAHGWWTVGVPAAAAQHDDDSTMLLHVHIGDYLEVLSNGRYKSVVHRGALNPNSHRISIASIHSLPSVDGVVATAEELVDEQHPKGYKESSFTDFLNYLLTGPDITRGRRSFLDTLKINAGP